MLEPPHRPCKRAYTEAARRRVHLATAIPGPPSGHRPGRRLARYIHIRQIWRRSWHSRTMQVTCRCASMKRVSFYCHAVRPIIQVFMEFLVLEQTTIMYWAKCLRADNAICCKKYNSDLTDFELTCRQCSRYGSTVPRRARTTEVDGHATDPASGDRCPATLVQHTKGQFDSGVHLKWVKTKFIEKNIVQDRWNIS